jgi:hypothetical protein
MNPNDVISNLHTEDEKEAIIESYLKSLGWKVERQVIPDEDIGKEYPRKIDLIIESPYPETQNEKIGIELKNYSIDAGAEIAGAFRQISNYRKLTYNGKKISLWCICPLKGYGNNYGNYNGKFIREFFNYFGIGMMELSNYEWRLDFGLSTPDTKIPISSDNWKVNLAELNINRIKTQCMKKEKLVHQDYSETQKKKRELSDFM